MDLSPSLSGATHFCLSREGGKVVLHGFPEDFFIDAEVFVNQDIADSPHLGSGDIGKAGLDFRWDMVCCFTDDFEITNNGSNGFSVTGPCQEVHALGVVQNMLDRFADVIDSQLPVSSGHGQPQPGAFHVVAA